MELEKIEIAEHEFDIILYMRNDKGFCAKMCSCLRKKYFNSDLMGTMFQVAKHFFERYGEFPSRTTYTGWLMKAGVEQEKFEGYLDALEDQDKFLELSSGDRNFIETTVVEFAKHSRMKEAIIESYDLLAENKFGEINEKIQDALKFNVDINLGVDLFDIDTRYLRLQNNLKERISTGFPNFDVMLGGGWSRKEIYCVLGPPGMGKSIFLPNFGSHALFDGYNVVHYSFEMSEERVGLRYDGPIAKMNLNKLAENIDGVKRAYDIKFPDKERARLKIKEFPTGAASVLDIEAHLEQLKTYENFIPDVIIVDYGDIMQAARKTNNTYEEQGWIFRELRGLAIKYNCVLITATQARRDAVAQGGGTKATVGMEQVADSMEKVRILDGLFSIVQSVSDKANSIIKLWVAKNRNGPSGDTLEFKINYDMMLLNSKEKETKGKKDTTDTYENIDEDEEQETFIKHKMNETKITTEDLEEKYNVPTESKNITAKIEESK